MRLARRAFYTTGVWLLMTAATVFAAGGGHAQQGGPMSGNQGMFEQQLDVDGYRVTFHIMAAQPGKEMGGSHDVMVKLEKDGQGVTDVQINSKVIHPDDRSETRMMMTMGDWFMAGYDLGHEGQHQVMILFKTADGSKHKSGIRYPGN